MGYYSVARGEIVVTPAIPYAEGVDSEFSKNSGGSALLFQDFNDYDDQTFIVPRWEDEFKAYYIEDELNTILNTWGEGRTFDGYIEIHGEGDGIGDLDLWRLTVKNGKVAIVKAHVAWPED
jgi:hypothetical protein